MYICICNPTTDNEVRICVRRGACSLSDLQMQLGVAAQCGSCTSAVRDIIEEEHRGLVASPLPTLTLRATA